MKITNWAHSVNLLRWYGHYQNSGRYNADCIFDLHDAFSEYITSYKEINNIVLKNYPTADEIKRIIAKTNKKSSKSNTEMSTPILDQMLQGDTIQFVVCVPENIRQRFVRSDQMIRVMFSHKEKALLIAEGQMHKEQLNDDIIREMFSKIHVNLQDIHPEAPPTYSPNLTELEEYGKWIKLCFSTLAI